MAHQRVGGLFIIAAACISALFGSGCLGDVYKLTGVDRDDLREAKRERVALLEASEAQAELESIVALERDIEELAAEPALEEVRDARDFVEILRRYETRTVALAATVSEVAAQPAAPSAGSPTAIAVSVPQDLPIADAAVEPSAIAPQHDEFSRRVESVRRRVEGAMSTFVVKNEAKLTTVLRSGLAAALLASDGSLDDPKIKAWARAIDDVLASALERDTFSLESLNSESLRPALEQQLGDDWATVAAIADLALAALADYLPDTGELDDIDRRLVTMVRSVLASLA